MVSRWQRSLRTTPDGRKVYIGHMPCWGAATRLIFDNWVYVVETGTYHHFHPDQENVTVVNLTMGWTLLNEPYEKCQYCGRKLTKQIKAIILLRREQM